MKPLIIFLLFIAAVHLPGLAGAQTRVPLKTSDGAIITRPVPVPVKPADGTAVTPPANPGQPAGTPVSIQTIPQIKPNTDAPAKTPATTSTLPIDQLFKPFTAIQPPVLEQENSNQQKPAKP
ncbi:hypothetical protein [Chitinophaga sp. Cy-1792]|uniref:hypothetical protein n=1 Tax=Chitinophaga sp. Cy-1792 TaxID=2608339 RepID=UPI001422FFC5|nr:hypothetical protein [Chitinophaga sp. Cy-1792]NIG56974.1 hypothetical protein [Chitinophaga sp. Cy-1792]